VDHPVRPLAAVPGSFNLEIETLAFAISSSNRPLLRSSVAALVVKDAPEPRPVQGAEEGRIVAFPQVGRLHHRYERLAA
jgi:hypothetical protein